MLILHVRQSEVALADGRLDEAYELAVAHDVGRHRRGQRLLTRLTRAMVQRGQEHLRAGHSSAALADCEKAARIAGNVPEIVALRAAAVDAITHAQRRQQRQALAMAAARRHIDDGRLDLGEQLLRADAMSGTGVALLRNDIGQRRRVAADAARACRLALDQGDIDRAARELLRARAAEADHADVGALAASVHAALHGRIERAIFDGQLEYADLLLARLVALDPESGQARRHQATLAQLRDACRQIRQGAYAEASIAVARLLAQCDDAGWLSDLAEQLRHADQAIAGLKVGPLAWLNHEPSPNAAAHAPIIWQRPMEPSSPHHLPSQFLLQIDGVGSFLVLRQPVVTIGPISSPIPSDVALVAEPTIPPLTIARVEDDYFLRTTGATLGRLLANGERLDLSPRCKMTFRLPSAASTTAALDLTGARLARADVRRIILMDHDLIIGPGAASHIVTGDVDQPLVLHMRDGQLFCQSRPLPLDQSVNIAGVSLVLTRADSSRGGATT